MKRLQQVRRFFLAAMLIAALALVGCEGDDGAQGPPGPEGPAGPEGGGVGAEATANESCSVCHGPGGIRDIAVVHPQDFANNMTFSNISANTTDLTAVSVTFDVAGPAGPVTDDPGVNFGGRFTFAKLMPGAAAGDQSFWQSYINTVEVGAVGPEEGAPPVLDEAVQATGERTSEGNLVFDGLTVDGTAGTWTYTFAQDFSVNNPRDIDGDGDNDVPPNTLNFAPDNLNRISGQFEANQIDPDGFVQLDLEGNPVFDFVPSGVSPPANGPASRNIVATETCNACHRELGLHGGHRFEVEYCVTCHNPGTTDADSGNNVDMTNMIHKIHYGENLPSVQDGGSYIIVGYRNSIHDYSSVVWPGFPIGTPLACETCHAQDTGLADAGNFQTEPTMNSCGSCHDDVDFAAGVNHPFAVLDGNTSCGTAGCHVPTGSDIAVVDAHEITQLTAAAAFEYNIDGSNFDPATRELEIIFSVTDPTNADAPYNILTDAPFTADGSGLRLLVGWDPQELHNTGNDSIPAQPMRIDALASPTDNGDGTFSVTATIPEGIDAVRVGMEGHPNVNGENVPAQNVFANVSTGGAVTERRQIVDIDKCNACHGTLSLHGNNRTGEIGVCVICHNPDATDIAVRPATLDENEDGAFDNFAAAGVDGKREESIDFKRMIHGIHAGQADEHGISIRETGLVVYGFRRSLHDYSHVRYPVADNGLRNCDMCHVGTEDNPGAPPELPVPDEVLGSTIRTADPSLGTQAEIDAALETSSDDLNISPNAAVCSGCHTDGQIQSHMELNGASFGVLQENIQ